MVMADQILIKITCVCMTTKANARKRTSYSPTILNKKERELVKPRISLGSKVPSKAIQQPLSSSSDFELSKLLKSVKSKPLILILVVEKYEQRVVEQRETLKGSFKEAFEIAMADFESQMKEFQTYMY